MMRIHIVQKGDSLWRIAEQYGVDFEQLKAANDHLANENELMPGMKVYIPVMERQQQSPYLFPRRHEEEGSLREHYERNDGVHMKDNNHVHEQQNQHEKKNQHNQQTQHDRQSQYDQQYRDQYLRPERNEQQSPHVPRYPQNNHHQYVCSYCMQPLVRNQAPFHPYYERNMNNYER